MNYRKFHDMQYKSWNPHYAAVHSRSEARGIAIVLIVIFGLLTLIFC